MRTFTHLSVWIISVSFFLFLIPLTGFSQLKNNTNSTNIDFVQGTIVIKVKEGVGPFEKQDRDIAFGIPSLDEKAQAFAVTKLEKRFKHKPITKNSGLPDLSRIYRIKFPESQNVHEVVKVFADDPNIDYAEPLRIGKFTEIPNDPMYGSQQHLPQIMAAEAWDIHKGEDGDEVVIAINDSGTDWLHPDLTDNCWQNLGEDADGDGVTLEFNNGVWERDPDDLNGVDDDGNGYVDDVIGWDFHEDITVGDGSNPDPIWGGDGFEHGSHCAGIAAGRTNNGIGISSVSYNVKYMPIQVDDGNNTVRYGIDGVIYAAENGADIISNSWYHGYGYSPSENEAIQYAIGLGSIVCFAAANDNTSKVAAPAGYPGVISVAAVNPDDTRASFSNYGISVDVAAPGVSILSTLTNNGYASWSGTSMATPMVAGLFGLLKSYQPTWTNDQLIQQVIGTADDIDGINPGYEKALGSGRINAYTALVEENVEIQQELRLEFIDFEFEDEDGDDILEAGETISVSINLRNYAPFVTDENASITLTSFDPDIVLTTSVTNLNITGDEVFEIPNAFEFTISEDTETHLADFLIEVNSDLPIMYGGEMETSVIIEPSGFFVWEGEANTQDYSGTFVKNYLEERGYDVLYSNIYPQSFIGFDAVFLSFGNSGPSTLEATAFSYLHSLTMQEYLKEGGRMYCEGAPVFFLSEYQRHPGHDEFLSLFGISSILGGFELNPISKLSGQSGSIHEGMVFNASHQEFNWHIDKIIPDEGAEISFAEEGYGNVSVYNEGEYGQKTFSFSYSLSELIDEDPHSSRYNFMVNVMDFFGYPEEDGLVANFYADKTDGEPELQVQFSDWSITEDSEITTWAWDFDEDGEIDSFEQNPEWTFSHGGVFDVSLVVFGDEGEIDTLVKKDFITVRSGILVYEGKKNENGYSGTFIHDYLEDHWYDNISYTNKFPESLDGYDAVFLSFGNTGLRGTTITNHISTELFNFSLAGGKIYLEGGDAIHSMNQSHVWVFGIDNSENGDKNEITELTGMEEAITEGMEFSTTNQWSVRSIDTYSVFETLPGAKASFTENDYGTVAVEFDGSQGQKTYCMSYAIADLEDNGGMNTREELLQRIINFFDVTVGVENQISEKTHDELKVFPNPASDKLTLEFLLEQNSSVIIEIFDLSGRKIAETSNNFKKGKQQIDFNVSGIAAGINYIRVNNGEKMKTIKWVKVD